MPSATITVRPATESDIPAILRFIRALADYEKLSHQVIATENLLRQNLFGPQRAAEALIGSLDNTPVGYALFFTTFSTFLAKPGIWLEDLFVLPEHRGHGVGKSLLQAVAQIAHNRHCGRLEWSVLDWNESAIHFYESAGANVMPDWRICRVEGESLKQIIGDCD